MISLVLSPTHPEGQRLRRQIAIGLTVCLSIVIAALTLTSIGEVSNVAGSDKLHHFLAFAALTAPCALLYPKSLTWLLPAALVFGGAIEIIQPSVGRGAEWADFLADTLGIAAGTAIGLVLRLTLKKWVDGRPASQNSIS
ncbi:putative integral membrane protein [Ruegeria atlantica]|uniref:Putative integral membrane protein n=1 Tax=Ruegeria atlantica TaxID=81569 RepID=A0A0P1E1I0_9RHOB|nr:putative integral membrane protein [Ruegeria atlantica]